MARALVTPVYDYRLGIVSAHGFQVALPFARCHLFQPRKVMLAGIAGYHDLLRIPYRLVALRGCLLRDDSAVHAASKGVAFRAQSYSLVGIRLGSSQRQA